MRWFKILNHEEFHNGLKFHIGLVKDILPFNPIGDCQPGGIYFTDAKHILCFVDYGPWVREVQIPEGAQVYENPGEPKKWKADKLVLLERRTAANSIAGIE